MGYDDGSGSGGGSGGVWGDVLFLLLNFWGQGLGGAVPLACDLLRGVLWCGGHAEVDRYLGSARNRVWVAYYDLELVCNEAVLSRERRPGIHTTHLFFFSKRGTARVNKKVSSWGNRASFRLTS